MARKALSRETLGRMFLKVLWEHRRPGGAYQDRSWDYEGIIARRLAPHFGLARLTRQEQADARAAVAELERGGLIVQDPTQSARWFKILTEAGEALAREPLIGVEGPEARGASSQRRVSRAWPATVRLRADLRQRVFPLYLAGDRSDALRAAVAYLEERAAALLGPRSGAPAGVAPDAATLSALVQATLACLRAADWSASSASGTQRIVGAVRTIDFLLDLLDDYARARARG
ncbi:MAG TPA: hypothetical protein VFU47_11310 [Armatimonadota bacterium]|nr:hypothetical protein [Armatimonadota bacterium]